MRSASYARLTTSWRDSWVTRPASSDSPSMKSAFIGVRCLNLRTVTRLHPALHACPSIWDTERAAFKTPSFKLSCRADYTALRGYMKRLYRTYGGRETALACLHER